jgi:RNA polymerase sigma factor (sigma-70 family)
MGPTRDEEWREERLFNFLPTVQEVATRLVDGAPPGIGIDDLVSIGVLALIDAMDRHPPDAASFPAYVRLRIQAAIVDEIRELDGAPRALLDLAQEDRPEAHPHVLHAQRREQVRAVLPLLGPRERRVAELHWLRDRSLADVADILGLPETRVAAIRDGIHLKLADLLGMMGAAA